MFAGDVARVAVTPGGVAVEVEGSEVTLSLLQVSLGFMGGKIACRRRWIELASDMASIRI